MSKYDEAMKQLEVTEAMRQRILQNIQRTDLGTEPKRMVSLSWKRYLSIAACLVVLLVGTWAVPNLLNRTEDPPVLVTPGQAEYHSAEELSAVLGFALSDLESLPFSPTVSQYTAYAEQLAEIYYEADEKSVVYRKSVGETDNSGDYNNYAAVLELVIDGQTVTLKGDGETYSLAWWTDGGYAFSLNFSYGLRLQEWEHVLSGLQ